jgi:hypothetical protein
MADEIESLGDDRRKLKASNGRNDGKLMGRREDKVIFVKIPERALLPEASQLRMKLAANVVLMSDITVGPQWTIIN